MRYKVVRVIPETKVQPVGLERLFEKHRVDPERRVLEGEAEDLHTAAVLLSLSPFWATDQVLIVDTVLKRVVATKERRLVTDDD